VSERREAGWHAVVAGTVCVLLALAALIFVSADLAIRRSACTGACRPATLGASVLLLVGAILLVHGITARLRR
jgi:hypothetical protein